MGHALLKRDAKAANNLNCYSKCLQPGHHQNFLKITCMDQCAGSFLKGIAAQMNAAWRHILSTTTIRINEAP